MATSSRYKYGLIGVVVAGLVMIIASHLMMGNAEDAANKNGDNAANNVSHELVTPTHFAIETLVMHVGDKDFSVFIANNDAAQEFAKTAPFTIDMVELNGNEKYYKGPDKFESKLEEIQPGRIKAGDLMLYGDDTVVLFYDSLDTTESYTRLGWVQNAYELADALGNGDVSVEFTKQ